MIFFASFKLSVYMLLIQLLQGDGGKDKNSIILCKIKAMTQKTCCVSFTERL